MLRLPFRNHSNLEASQLLGELFRLQASAQQNPKEEESRLRNEAHLIVKWFSKDQFTFCFYSL